VQRRASAVVGFVLLAQVAAARLLLRATPDGVTFLGRPLGGACAFRRLTGWPCPTCGMTRSVVLALHGHVGAAFQANFAGPAWIAVVTGMAMALLSVAWWESRVRQRWVRVLGLAGGAVFVAVLVTHWIYVVTWHA